MPKKNILILGAGLSGLSAALHLEKRGINYRVFEKEPEVGGLCRSKKINGFTFDYDGHLLHFRHRYTFELIKGLLKGNLREHKRSSWVYSYGRYTPYPFQANLHGLPPHIVEECLLGYLETSRNNGHKRNGDFLSWINQTFGRGIAKYFMIPYNTKFWTLPPQSLTSEWLDGFIPVPSLNQIIEGSIEGSKREFGYNAHFWYPKDEGIRQVALALAGQVKNIHRNCGASQIDVTQKKIKIGESREEKFDYLISTIPLPEVKAMIKGIPMKVRKCFGQLRWNSIFNLNLGVENSDNLFRHWVYFPEKEVSFFRVGFPHNFSDSVVPKGKKSLYAEVSYSKDKRINKQEVASRIKSDLKKVGILNRGDKIISEDVNDIKYGYPIYDRNYRKAVGTISGYLREKNIITCGRFGSWRYMSMEGAILDGKRAAESI